MERQNGLTLFWFRRDLRLNDNTGLHLALKSSNRVLPLFIFDTEILDKLTDKADRRISFIYTALEMLQTELVAAGSSLLVMHGKPVEIFKLLTDKYSIEAVYTNHDYEPYAFERDSSVSGLLKTKQIPFYSYKDQVIFEKQEILKSDGTPYTVFTPYSKLWKQKVGFQGITFEASEKLKSNLFRTAPIALPTFESLGFIRSITAFAKPKIDEAVIRSYHLTRNLPYLNGTSNMGTHLRFGTVSIRMLVSKALELNEQWLNELIWREFFMMILSNFPYVVDRSFKSKYDLIAWRNDETEFLKWCNGETGYPIVDAGMRELNETGLMHNRVRMVVASFLTKDLLIDWRWGEKYFAEKLLDYELSSNNGNWQWAAGTGCDAAPYFRIFNPTEQAARYDPDSLYIKKWVKEFGTPDYAAPMVDHKFARLRALDAFKKALNHG
jgi:deoxyribodipyrimidine photo-lyase